MILERRSKFVMSLLYLFTSRTSFTYFSAHYIILAPHHPQWIVLMPNNIIQEQEGGLGSDGGLGSRPSFERRSSSFPRKMRRQPWSGVRKVILTVLSLVILVASLVTWPWWYPWLIWRDSNTSWVTTGPGKQYFFLFALVIWRSKHYC